MARRDKPADPQAITARNALRRAEEAAAQERRDTEFLAEQERRRKDPVNWGVAPGQLDLSTANDKENPLEFERVRAERGQVIRARRQSDAFDILWKAGGLSKGQHLASERYWKDWCQSAGIQTHDHHSLERVDGGRHDGISQGAISAGERIAAVHAKIGRRDAALLTALTEGPATRGEIRVWRWLVQQLTGETERHVQAGCVRQALENLRLGYEDVDAERPTRPHATPNAA